jgi:methylenetetrahydrofolate reductase (NADPH)
VTAPCFEVVCEIDPPARPEAPDLGARVDALAPIATRFLVPDGHTGRAAVSSLVLAAGVQARGHRAVACLNARDRNLLGLRRDLLTARYLGIEELLLVYGDETPDGARTRDVTVRSMLDELRSSAAGERVRASVTTRLRPLPQWKQDADSLFVQVTYSIDELLRWRDGVRFDGPVFAGVLVASGYRMAVRLGERVPELRMPARWLDALASDDRAGVDLACRHIEQIRGSGAFDGVHLVCGARAHDVVARLGSGALGPPVAVPCGTMRR